MPIKKKTLHYALLLCKLGIITEKQKNELYSTPDKK